MPRSSASSTPPYGHPSPTDSFVSGDTPPPSLDSGYASDHSGFGQQWSSTDDYHRSSPGSAHWSNHDLPSGMVGSSAHSSSRTMLPMMGTSTVSPQYENMQTNPRLSPSSHRQHQGSSYQLSPSGHPTDSNSSPSFPAQPFSPYGNRNFCPIGQDNMLEPFVPSSVYPESMGMAGRPSPYGAGNSHHGRDRSYSSSDYPYPSSHVSSHATLVAPSHIGGHGMDPGRHSAVPGVPTLGPVSEFITDYGAPPGGEFARNVVASSRVVQASVRRRKNPPMFACSLEGCGQTFTTRTNYDDHMRAHSNMKPFKCEEPTCDRAFARRHELKRHLRTVHSTERPYACDRCTAAYARSDQLSKHLAGMRCRGYP